jgi:hypothetical protein
MCNIHVIRHISKVSDMPHRCVPLQKKKSTSSSVGDIGLCVMFFIRCVNLVLYCLIRSFCKTVLTL